MAKIISYWAQAHNKSNYMLQAYNKSSGMLSAEGAVAWAAKHVNMTESDRIAALAALEACREYACSYGEVTLTLGVEAKAL